MKTLIFIHGADSFSDESAYLEFLEKSYIPRQLSPWEDIEKSDYRKNIARRWVENGWKVYYPTMPNKQNARYRDWKMVFESILWELHTDDDITLVGTSLWWCFLLKYFSEKTLLFSKKYISQIHLIAACLSEWDFIAPEDYNVLKNLWNRVHIWHAEDDRVVPFATAKFLENTLPWAQTHFFASDRGYGHFHRVEKIPEFEWVVFSN